MATLGNLVVNISAKTEDLQAGLNKAQASIGKTEKVMAALAVGGAAAAAGALVTVGLALKGCVEEAMAAQEIQADLNAVLESTKGAAGLSADEINRMATALSEVTRFEDDNIVSGQSMLLTFTKIGKDVFPQATEAMLDMATKFKMDLPQAAIILGKALNDPIAGVGALRRIGVMLTDEQKDMIGTMVDLGDVAGAQRIILGELKTEIGGVARAAGETAPGKFDILKNKIGNIKEEIGGAFLPLLERVATMLSSGLGSATAKTALMGLQIFIAGVLVPQITLAFDWIATVAIPKALELAAAFMANKDSIAAVVSQIAIFATSPLAETLAAQGKAVWILNLGFVQLKKIVEQFQAGLRLFGVDIDRITGKSWLMKLAWDKIGEVFNFIVGGPGLMLKRLLDAIVDAINIISTLNINHIIGDLVNIGARFGIMGFAGGGMVPGPLGMPQLAVVHGGEMVLNPQQQMALSGSLNVNVTGDGGQLSNARVREAVYSGLNQVFREYQRR